VRKKKSARIEEVLESEGFSNVDFVDYSRKRFKVARKFIVFFSRIDLIDTDEAASDP